jgi:uncharacterized protein YjiS (DUF1127 family)
MSQLMVARHPTHSYHPIQAAVATLRRVQRRFARWSARRRAYAQLLSLGDRELQDIGMSRAQALFEHDRPIWRG